jgi:hypothetical protein
VKRVLLYAALIVVLAGCSAKLDNVIGDGEYVESDFAVACLDGTAYWVRKAGHSGYMSPKIDRETRLPAECDS